MRNFIPLLLLSVLLTVSCSDDKEPYSREKVEREIADISEVLGVGGASIFASVLKDLSADEIRAEELTVFAVQDRAYTRSGSISHENILRHIVRGRYTLSDLKTVGTLTAVNGDELMVFAEGNNVYVNEVLLKQGTTVSNSIIFYVEEELPLWDRPNYFETFTFSGTVSIMAPSHEDSYIWEANIPIKLYDKRGNLLTSGSTGENGHFEIRYESPSVNTPVDVSGVTYEVVYPGYTNLFQGWVVVDYVWQVNGYFNHPEKYPEDYPKYTFGLILKDLNFDGVIDEQDKVSRAPMRYDEGDMYEGKILLIPDNYEWPQEEIL